jgi:hypothetical protein
LGSQDRVLTFLGNFINSAKTADDHLHSSMRSCFVRKRSQFLGRFPLDLNTRVPDYSGSPDEHPSPHLNKRGPSFAFIVISRRCGLDRMAGAKGNRELRPVRQAKNGDRLEDAERVRQLSGYFEG